MRRPCPALSYHWPMMRGWLLLAIAALGLHLARSDSAVEISLPLGDNVAGRLLHRSLSHSVEGHEEEEHQEEEVVHKEQNGEVHALENPTHDAVSEVSVGVAGMLFISLCTITGILYLVNYKDADIRVYSYSMMSDTICIISAVTLNAAIQHFVLVQVLESPWPRGLGLKVTPLGRFGVGITLFTVGITTLLIICYNVRSARDRHQVFFIVESLGGHLCAFAGIEGARPLQQYFADTWGRDVIMVLVCTFVVWALLLAIRLAFHYGIATSYRKRVEEKDCTWLDVAAETQDEASMFIVSWLFNNMVILWITGKMPIHHVGPGDYHNKSEMRWMCGCSLFFCVLYTVLVIPITRVAASIPEHTLKHRLVRNLSQFLVLQMSWCLFRLSKWQVLNWMVDVGKSGLTDIVCALVVSLSAVFLMIIIDWLADKMIAHDSDGSSTPRYQHSDGDFKAAVAGEVSEPSDSDSGGAYSPSNVAVGATPQQLVELKEQVSDNLRQLVRGLALVIALSWEQAFDTSEDSIIRGFDILKAHPVLSPLVFGVALSAYLLIAWKKFIVKRAMMSKEEHQKCIDEEIQLQEEIELQDSTDDGDGLAM